MTRSVAWDPAGTPEAAAVERGVRAAAGRRVVVSLPTSRPGLTPRDLRWRPFRREMTPPDRFQTLKRLLTAARAFCERSQQQPSRRLAVSGSPAHKVLGGDLGASLPLLFS